jgi:hypothetical protein
MVWAGTTVNIGGSERTESAAKTPHSKSLGSGTLVSFSHLPNEAKRIEAFLLFGRHPISSAALPQRDRASSQVSTLAMSASAFVSRARYRQGLGRWLPAPCSPHEFVQLAKVVGHGAILWGHALKAHGHHKIGDSIRSLLANGRENRVERGV